MNRVLAFLAARWKALAPLVAFGATYAIQHGFDITQLRSLTGIKEFVGIVIVAILVHTVPNGWLPTPAAKKDDGYSTLVLILIVLGIILLLILIIQNVDIGVKNDMGRLLAA